MDKQKKHKNAEMGNSVFHRIVLNQIAGNTGFEEEEENVPCNTPRRSACSRFGGSSGKFGASTSGSTGTQSVSPGEYVRDPGSILSLQPWIFKRSSAQNNEEMVVPSGSRAVGRGKNLVDGFRDGSTIEVSARSPGLGPGSGRGRGALRSRRPQRNFIKPFVATENSYIPQLYNENFEFEECTLAPLPSPASARPFIVTDGRRIISKSCYEPVPVPFDIGFDKKNSRNGSKVPESVVGIPPLPEMNKSRTDRRVSQDASLSLPGSQRGLIERMLMFSSGVGIGILSSSLSSKKDVDSLQGTLKRMENLVQDLQDELEMKEGLTVKELPNEMSAEQDDDNTKAHTADSVPMSKIEAELEAELARLELNITSNHLEEQPFDFSEMDQEFIGDIIQGELKTDMVRHDIADYSSESDHRRDSRQSSPDCTRDANYPVSPRDLSIRLHKVIQRRLEDRIKELETALAQSQKQAQLQIMARERAFSEQTCSNSDSGSSNQDSPLFLQETSSSAEPFCLNLAGDALEAYDEAYEEFMRIADSPCTTSTNGKPQVNEDYSVEIWGLEEDRATEINNVPTWEQDAKSGEPDRAQESDGNGEGESESGDDDDHNSKMLIQQIVERTKQGSPVLINAQRMLFSVDD